MIHLKKLRDLNFNRPSFEKRPPFITSASGLIFFNKNFYFIADDENKLFFFKENEELEYINLRPNLLPDDEQSRKKMKSDFESLLKIDNKILVIPSGSTENRRMGYLINSIHKIEKVDFTNLYKALDTKLKTINIEAAVLIKNEIIFFNRGNTTYNTNALIRLRNEFPLSEKSLLEVIKIEIGHIDSVPLTITDASLFNDSEICLTAVAEDSLNSYDDGDFKGAVLVQINILGQVLNKYPLVISEKPEGLCFIEKSKNFYLVTDADDSLKPSGLYFGQIP